MGVFHVKKTSVGENQKSLVFKGKILEGPISKGMTIEIPVTQGTVVPMKIYDVVQFDKQKDEDKKIGPLKKKYKFRIMIDDAHGFGVMGEHGRGTSEHFGVMDEIDIYIGAYAKSMAIIGGFVAADKDIIDYLKYNMRSQIYAKSLPMPIVEGCLKRLDIIDSPEAISYNISKQKE